METYTNQANNSKNSGLLFIRLFFLHENVWMLYVKLKPKPKSYKSFYLIANYKQGVRLYFLPQSCYVFTRKMWSCTIVISAHF